MLSDMVFAFFSKILCGNLILPKGIGHVYFYEIKLAKLIYVIGINETLTYIDFPPSTELGSGQTIIHSLISQSAETIFAKKS